MCLSDLDILTRTCLNRAGWLRILEEQSHGDSEKEQVVLCGGAFV